MFFIRCSVLLVVAFGSGSDCAYSVEKLQGYFIATESCEAYQSKNNRSNPGAVKTRNHNAYRLLGVNKPDGDFYQIVVPGAPQTEDRWVARACGLHVVEFQESGSDAPLQSDPTGNTGSESSENLLALSWQPAFCEIRSSKPECKALNNGQLPSATQRLSIHGLWPQPRGKNYCGVSAALRTLDLSGQWSELPEPELSEATGKMLFEMMPGSASLLHRHEWIKHGSCHFAEGGADDYFQDTLRITRAVNESAIGIYLQENTGRLIQTIQIRRLFDTVFGDGAGSRVQFHCVSDAGRILLQEIKINLSGVINKQTPVSELLLAAGKLSIGCPQGFIDPAGLQ